MRTAAHPESRDLSVSQRPLVPTVFARFGAVIGLCLLVLACYWQVWKFEFVNYDDTDYVSKNPWVQKGLTREAVSWAVRSDHASNWHPLTWISHMLDWHVYGKNAGGHHFTNVLLHLANTVLLLLVLRKMTGAFWRSFAVAALFALHPLHVESVAWVSERKDVLSTFFGLISLWFYTAYAVGRKAIIPTSSAVRYSAALFFFALSLMSKPMLVTLPFLLLLLDIWPLRRWHLPESFNAPGERESEAISRLLLEKAPFLLLTILSCAITIKVQSGKTVQALSSFGLLDRFANVLVAYATYLAKMIYPADLAFFYPLLGAPPIGQVIVAGLLLVLISVAALFAWKRFPFIPVGWFWYLGTLVPVIGFVHVGEQALADRYTYVPLIGVFVAGIWWMHERFRLRPLPGGALLSITTLLLAWGTYQQIGFWRNSTTLLERALAVTRDNFVAHNNYAVVLSEQGRHEEAITHYRRAVAIKPLYARAFSNLGSALTMTGRYEEAITNFHQALSIRPEDAETHYNLAVTLARMRDYAGTIRHCEEALRLDPGYFTAHYDLAVALSLTDRNDEALPHFLKYLESVPADFNSHVMVAQIFLQAGNASKAIEHSERAIAISAGKDPMVFRVLAASYAAGMNYEKAASALEQSAALFREKNRPDLAVPLEREARNYRQTNR